MDCVLHKWRLWGGSRGGKALFLVAVLLINAILPSLASAEQNKILSHEMTSDLMDHANMDHAQMGHATSATSQDPLSAHENHEMSLHCMSSICCFQDASAPFALVASDAYLTNRQVVDPGSDLPSILHSTKDRPPRQI